MPETGRYLYAVSRDLAAADLDGLVGLSGGHVETVPCDEIVGVVSSVDLGEFGEEPLRRNLERLDWLSDVARTHDAVVQAVAARAPVAPMRLATIFADDAAIAARLRATYDGLVAALDRVEGRHEWSVKVLVPDGAAAAGHDLSRRRRRPGPPRRVVRRAADRAGPRRGTGRVEREGVRADGGDGSCHGRRTCLA